MPTVLNLSREVVKMRSEVKRVRVLIIRKLTRQISALKKKKGTEADLQRNQRRVTRLLEEIHELRVLAPDTVTKAALQKDISFEKVCQNPQAGLSERATARIVTHPQFSKKIRSIKDAIKAFKEERISAAKSEKRTKKEAEELAVITDAGGSDDGELGEAVNKEREEKSDDCCREILNAGTDESLDVTKEDGEKTAHVGRMSSETEEVPEKVVRMRKEVKKIRVLIIHKLTHQIGVLKGKKGEPPEVEENRRNAATLLEEIRVLRSLRPDEVTNAALLGNANLEEMSRDPKGRAAARIITHDRFVAKLQAVSEALQKEQAKCERTLKQRKKVSPDSLGRSGESDGRMEEEEKKEFLEGVEGSAESEPKERDASRSSLLLRTQSMEVKPAKPPVTQPGLPEGSSELEIAPNSPRKHESPVKKTVKDVPLPKSKQVHQPERKKPEQENEEEEEEHESESDLESSEDEEEKEYFDDSTEERFHKQSSQSEESDHDDFFLGKVSKFKKRKSDPAPGPQKEKARGQEGAIQKQDLGPARLQSVFCSTLASAGHQKPKQAFGRGGPKPPRFQNQSRQPEGASKASWVKSRGPEPPFERKQNHRPAPGKTLRPPQTTQQALHPSWEASRKRKEQQGQIAAFQGKKIKFDDDDD
ncbi:serum response factor-binding protein 1-like [Denticeps clupeoides]|uniref:serum response factor-binding protein 1-like n=1 Tax=Denticeps clupeoides TaxID=299321 RepID=UPI0010A3A4CE|nr:serum response factor-binding protein 1-like [Denticeps clupeoides]